MGPASSLPLFIFPKPSFVTIKGATIHALQSPWVDPGFITMPRKGADAKPGPSRKTPAQGIAVVKESLTEQAVITNTEHPTQHSIGNNESFSFTQSQLSLALSIQKSKPPGVGTRGMVEMFSLVPSLTYAEYCLQLQEHVKLGRAPAEGEHRHIDTAEFWREQYSRLHLEKKALEVQVSRLELLSNQDDSVDLARTEHLKDVESRYAQSGRKRKYNAAEFEDPQVHIAKQPPSHVQEPGVTHCKPTDDRISVLCLGRIGLPLLKNSLLLHQLLRDNAASSDGLISSIQSCLSNMRSTIDDMCRANASESKKDEDDFMHRFYRALNIVAAVFNMSVEGLALLCRDISGRRCKGQVISSLMDFFITVLNHLHICCLQEARLKLSSTNHDQRQDGHCSLSDQNGMTAALIPGFSNLLVNIMTCPEFDKTHPSHFELLEGMFSVLLEEIGALLSHAVFGEYLSSSSTPGWITSANGNTVNTVEEYAIELKGRYLTSVLKAAMGGQSESYILSLLGMRSGTAVPGTSPGKEVLFTRAKRRLQATLLKGLFGDDCKEFMNALKQPEPGKTPDLKAPQVTPNSSGSFVESVWSVIGWDMVLGSE